MDRRNLPAFAVRGIVPIPNNDFRSDIGRPMSLKALDEAEKAFDNQILILVQKNPLIDNPTPSDIEEYGALAKVTMKVKLPNGNIKAKFSILKRVKILDYFLTNPFFVCEYEEVNTISDDFDKETTLTKMVLNEAITNANAVLNNPQEILRSAQSGITTEKMADIIVYGLKGNEMNKYKYLSELNLNARLQYILEDIARQKMVSDLEREINEEVRRSIDESQKEYYLREKMRAIQNELGDKAKREDEIEELREKIEKAKMPKQIEEKALQELARYSSMNPMMAESSIIKTYLDFLIDLPWHKQSKDVNSIKKVQEKLDENHYGLDKVKDRIIEYLAVKIKTKKNPQTILCLVGPPGTGKTSLGVSIANALGRKFVKQSLGGIRDEAEIRGHRRTYIGALPGRILKGMKDAGTINPVFLLDEIDKMSRDFRGDPASAMLEVLDPEQNSHFSDNYLEETYDLSKVLFITTANYLENIPAPLKDRMEIVELSSYTEFEKFNITRQHLIPKQLEAHGMKENEFSITDEAIYKIIQNYTREAGVREVNRVVGTLIRKGIKEILVDKIASVSVTDSNLESYLGQPKYRHNILDQTDQVGVVTGLAYTQFGGDTLPIEVNYYEGTGKIHLTGKLGEVMKESAETALSYVKANQNRFKIPENIFKENDFHIHVPQGAIPKDGPSAGITIACAIISAATGKKVNRKIGMTGEMTLRGYVLSIGGLREKSIAAHRSGLEKIFIPRDNMHDIEEVPEEVKEKLEIVPIANIDDVVGQIFVE
ncbi:MAG: endopeptidase La [Acholeplasmataceae bacterium]|jgi:ATP-dependent Lon protease|nr:endopeptidase La [Acholeplasmataceae bacterium]